MFPDFTLVICKKFWAVPLTSVTCVQRVLIGKRVHHLSTTFMFDLAADKLNSLELNTSLVLLLARDRKSDESNFQATNHKLRIVQKKNGTFHIAQNSREQSNYRIP